MKMKKEAQKTTLVVRERLKKQIQQAMTKLTQTAQQAQGNINKLLTEINNTVIELNKALEIAIIQIEQSEGQQRVIVPTQRAEDKLPDFWRKNFDYGDKK